MRLVFWKVPPIVHITHFTKRRRGYPYIRLHHVFVHGCHRKPIIPISKYLLCHLLYALFIRIETKATSTKVFIQKRVLIISYYTSIARQSCCEQPRPPSGCRMSDISMMFQLASTPWQTTSPPSADRTSPAMYTISGGRKADASSGRKLIHKHVRKAVNDDLWKRLSRAKPSRNLPRSHSLHFSKLF